MRLEQLEPAARAFTAAVELQEDHVPALHNLGTVMEKAGRKTEAEYYFIQVQALTPHLHTIEGGAPGDLQRGIPYALRRTRQQEVR